ncbi:uncharacterized protein [Paralichthys olivaceus]|uniref:uncharacterized protein n=1 Tax=Paralichthys olivaceus TaxID=8255 RepID=UPI0037507B93
MAAVAALPKETCSLEKQLTCSICLDLFEDPVTTACGHSFCKNCLNINCKFNDTVCPLCKNPLSNTAAVNIVLRDIAEQRKLEKSEKKNKSIFTGEDGEVACDICTERKLPAEKSCLVCLASYCPTHLENHYSTERLKGHKLVAPVKNLDDRACLKHGRPLELYSKKQQRCICVRCLEESPEEVVSNEDEWGKKKVELENARTELEAKIKRRETQLDELNKSVRSCKDLLENEWWDIEAVFNAVLAIVEDAQARALQPLKDRRQVLEKEAENLKKDLEAEISRFKTTISELDDISTHEDHIHFLQNYPSLQDLEDIKDWAEVQLDTSLCFGTMRKTTTRMMEKVQQELEKLTSTELKRIPKFTVDVKLDPTTAHQRLVLSDDGKEVKDGEEDREVDESPERFDVFGSVLGLNSFTSGKSYWEVEVGDKAGWDLGVARSDADRKGKLSLKPDDGYWVTVHYENDKYAALTAPPLSLSLQDKPEKVGVFVDYEEGLVSFYNVGAQSHVYSFTGCSFGGELLPYFSPHRKQDGENGDPLIISAVKQCEQIMDESSSKLQSRILNTFDMSLQVCGCGWSKVTTYQGLRTHQGKIGCTVKGMRIPESKGFRADSYFPQITFMGPRIQLKEPVMDVFTSSLTSGDSDMSLQVCGCGWSKVTTYQGLRTHQGKMGCTVKGMRIPESKGYRADRYFPQITFTGPRIELKEPVMDVFTSSLTSDDSDLSLQVCGCGWSKATTYQGLRTHQRKMGCTAEARGLQTEYYQRNGGPGYSTPVKTENVSPNLYNQMTPDLTAATEAVREMMKSMVVNQQQSAQTGPNMDKAHRALEFSFGAQPLFGRSPQTPTGHIYPAAADVTANEPNEPLFQTPVHHRLQTVPNTDKARRALDFSTGAEQVQAQTLDPFRLHAGEQLHPVDQVTEQVFRTPPTTTVSPREDEEEKEREAEKLRVKKKQDNTRAELQQKIKIRELKMAEVRLSVKGFKVSLDSEWLEIHNVFSEVMKVVEDALQKALPPLEERRRNIKREAKHLLQRLDGEIDKLKTTIAELDGNPDSKISLDEPTFWNNTSVDTSFSFGTFRSTTSAMMEQIQLQIEKLSSVELKRIPTFAVDVKLDPATAHHSLSLSNDGKKVRDGGKNQTVPDAPQRFDMFGSILGLNSLTSGRSYWEVEVGRKTGWDLGVARGDANRKGMLSLSPDNGYWATVHYEDKGYAALTAPPVSLSLSEKPQKVGVFVDYEEGLVSFYDTKARSHIYSFTDCSFGGEIFPYFSPHLEQNGQNSAPLIISSVERP